MSPLDIERCPCCDSMREPMLSDTQGQEYRLSLGQYVVCPGCEMRGPMVWTSFDASERDFEHAGGAAVVRWNRMAKHARAGQALAAAAATDRFTSLRGKVS